MTLTSSTLLRILAFVAFVIYVVLILVKAAGGTFEEILPVTGLALWVLSTLTP